MNDYLKNTTLEKNDVRSSVRNYLKNMRIVVLFAVALVIGGFVSYKNLPQTVAPEINITLLVVSAALPGATPEDVETLLTIPLEDELKSVSGIDTVESTANSSLTSIVMTFVRGTDKNRALADVEAALGRVGDLPEDATEPRVEAVDFEDAPIVQWIFAQDTVEGQQQVGTTSLSTKTQKLIDLLESDQKIDRVITGGQPEQEVQILITPEAMSTYGITPNSVRQSVAAGIATLPSGTVDGVSIERSVSIEASVKDIADMRNLPITLEGADSGAQIITLGDIATIVERPTPSAGAAYLYERTHAPEQDSEPRQIVTVDVYRTSGVDLADTVEKTEQITEEFLAADGKGLRRYEIFNADTELSDQFNELIRNLATTILLVFITLTLFVGRRQALLAAISIPLIYGVAFIAMQITGISVNFLSLFSLTISLGLLVDVTIVIVSAMTAYMREGSFGAHKTGVLVFRDFFVTLIMTTLTTVWAFVPLLLAGGIIGEYIKPIPVVVSSVLGASVLVGFFIILPLMIWLFDFAMPRRIIVMLRLLIFAGLVGFFIQALNIVVPLAILAAIAVSVMLYAANLIIKQYRKSRTQERGEAKKAQKDIPKTFIDISGLQARYAHTLDKVLSSRVARWKTIAMVTIFFVFACSLVAAGLVKGEFFPGGDNHFLYVGVEMPDGTKSEQSEVMVEGLLPLLGDVDGVSYAIMQVGFAAVGEGGTSRSSGNDVLFTLKTPEKKDGGRGANAVAEELRRQQWITDFTGGEISIIEQQGGPPAGADVTVTFIGNDLAVLRSLAHELQERSSGLQIENVAITPRAAAAIVAFEPDDYILSREGITRAEISSALRLVTAGVTLSEDVEFDGVSEKRDIVLRLHADNARLDDIGRVQVQTTRGTFPLDTLGRITLRENITSIKRQDFDRTVSLTAGVTGEANAGEINAEIATIIDEEMTLPAGYAWKTGGANEENNESVASIIQGMGLAAALIFLTLIIHLRSYRKAAIVLMTVPLAVSGVFVIFGIAGIPLSFPALIGLLALFGIVVNNAIIIIAQINANREVGLSFHEAVVGGASSRLEPILLSSLTTIIGLLPITLSDPIWQGLGGAIIAGLTFSGVIMLFFIPTLYYIIMSDEDPERIA